VTETLSRFLDACTKTLLMLADHFYWPKSVAIVQTTFNQGDW
jgi:hypothetical protein